ncbi:hypothetical protein [Brachyspira hyodysenteriae]|uniref:hypothetical protein n=1 Tax=Brachyspira hyodysenteriae TaxID=159 RepID=UPI0016430C80|nr:hypothetical protein [Brachyspira hyodysenteriae]
MNPPSYCIYYIARHNRYPDNNSISNAMRCDAMRCDAMRCDAMRCDAMRCDINTPWIIGTIIS